MIGRIGSIAWLLISYSCRNKLFEVKNRTEFSRPIFLINENKRFCRLFFLQIFQIEHLFLREAAAFPAVEARKGQIAELDAL